MSYRISSILMLLICATAATSCANQLQVGVDAFDRGEYDQAANHWNGLAQSGDALAEYNLGLLWEGGLGSTPRNLAQASQWFFRSAKQGFPPAMVRLANIQSASGHEEAALSWYVLAARWGDNDAITALIRLEKQVPPADLLAGKQRQDEWENAKAAAEASQANAMLGYAIGCAIAGGSCGPSNLPPSTTDNDVLSADPVDEECSSDYSCGVGYTCVKAPFRSAGICMKSVNEYGVQQYDPPSGDSVGPNLNLEGQCQLDIDCPIGFRCDINYKACIKR